jgi:putative DNA primase/helicase
MMKLDQRKQRPDQHPKTLDGFSNRPRWVAWRVEIKLGKNGKERTEKVPYDPSSDRQARVPTDPRTWGTRDEAEERCRDLLGHDDVGGVGIVLGQLDDGTLLMGIDLDHCIQSDDRIADWAVEVIKRFDTYAEVSPSGLGVKLFFFVAPQDAAAVKSLLGNNEKGVPKTRRTFPAGKHRESAIDRARFYAVTGDYLNGVPETLRTVAVADVRWFIEKAGPAYQRLHGVGGKRRGRDQTGSGHGFQFMAARKAAGDSYEAACAAILDDRGPAGEWARRTDDRQLERAWDRSPVDASLDVVCVADVPMKRVEWVWPAVLARGKITIVGGEPGGGKSQIAVYTAAQISLRDGKWPSGVPAPSGSTIILSAEDAVDDTIRPRLEAADADTERVFVIRAVDENRRRTFNLQHDLEQLEALIAKLGDVVLVVIDPVSSYMGDVENNTPTSVRPVLEAVADMAARTGVAVLLIHHPPKDTRGKAMNAFSGSLAYVAAPRISFIVVAEKDRDGEETGRMLFLAHLNRLGKLVDSMGFSIREMSVPLPDGGGSVMTSRVEWDTAPVTVTADEALRGPERLSRLDLATELLTEALSDGPLDYSEVVQLASEHKISERTLRDAKNRLKVESVKEDFQGKVQWQLPGRTRH